MAVPYGIIFRIRVPLEGYICHYKCTATENKYQQYVIHQFNETVSRTSDVDLSLPPKALCSPTEAPRIPLLYNYTTDYPSTASTTCH